MIKKLLIIFLVLFMFGCQNNNDDKLTLNSEDIKGYWVQTIRDWNGDKEDMTDEPYTYLKITDDRMFYYVLSKNDDEGVSLSNKYYRLEGNKLYYDFYKFKDENWKENIDELAGGVFEVSFKEDSLVFTEFYNDLDKDGGYDEEIFKKIDSKDWPIEE